MKKLVMVLAVAMLLAIVGNVYAVHTILDRCDDDTRTQAIGGADISRDNPVPTYKGDSTLSETQVGGDGVKCNFPTTPILTQVYEDTPGWQVLDSTYIDSANQGDYVGIDTSVAHGNGSYAAGTITSAVFDRGTTSNSQAPDYFIITISDSESAGVETVTYFYRTGTTNPPTGSWTSYTSASTIYNTDQYIQWYAYLTTGDSASFTPLLKSVSLLTSGYYVGGFKIYAVGMSVDNTIDSATFKMTEGAGEISKIFINMKSGRPDYWEFVSPITISGTCTITTGSGADVLIQYLDD